jgi:hypothetical protein
LKPIGALERQFCGWRNFRLKGDFNKMCGDCRGLALAHGLEVSQPIHSVKIFSVTKRVGKLEQILKK